MQSKGAFEMHKLKQQKGFTIIEVMIVLAIAGLIMLIVFLAVPALQRSSRNTNRKEDASRLASSVSTFVSNANGDLPCMGTSGTFTATGGTSTTNDAQTILSGAGKLGQLSFSAGANCGSSVVQNAFSIIPAADIPTAGWGNPPDNTVVLVLSASCSGNVAAASTNQRKAALMYPVGLSNGNYTWSCIDAL